jgi:hypothetical protein
MAPESQAKNIENAPGMQRIFGKLQRRLMKDEKFVDDVFVRRNRGDTIAKIAADLRCHINTIRNILQKHGGDPLARVQTILRDGMPKIADMVIVETLRKKDVRAGVQLLQGAGQLDALRPKPAVEDGGRIVIEWSGAPPPWSPAAVLKAYAERALPPAPPPKVDVVDAEVVSDAKNGEAGVEPQR